jgi:hypothetical protein
MIMYRNHYIRKNDWKTWNMTGCAEVSAGEVNKREKPFQFYSTGSSMAYWSPENRLFFCERSNKAIELLATYGIEISLDEIPADNYITTLNEAPIESIEVLTLTGYATFLPLAHSLMRVVRDDRIYQWALLEVVAHLMVTFPKDIKEDWGFSGTGTESWLKSHVHPNAWVPKFREILGDDFEKVMVAAAPHMSPTCTTAILSNSGYMDKIFDDIAGRRPGFKGIVADDSPDSFTNRYQSSRYLMGKSLVGKVVGNITTDHGRISSVYLPPSWYDSVEYPVGEEK